MPRPDGLEGDPIPTAGTDCIKLPEVRNLSAERCVRITSLIYTRCYANTAVYYYLLRGPKSRYFDVPLFFCIAIEKRRSAWTVDRRAKRVFLFAASVFVSLFPLASWPSLLSWVCVLR